MKSHDVDLKSIYLFILTVDTVICFSWNTLNLPKEHIPYFFNNNPDIKEECKRDEKCPFQVSPYFNFFKLLKVFWQCLT